jgi:hypothetical protein
MVSTQLRILRRRQVQEITGLQEGPGPARRGDVELGTGEGPGCEIPRQRVLRLARHRAGQIRDAAARIDREGVGGQRDRGIRGVEADILPDQSQLRGNGNCWPGAQETGSARPAQAAGRSAGVYPRATGCGRAPSSARTGQANRGEIPSRCPPEDDRAGGRGKKNRALTSDGGEGSGRLTGVVSQYEALRDAALGHPLPPEARYRLLLFLRRGMWGWARVMAVPGTNVKQEPRQGASLRFAAADESRAVIHAFAAMAMNAEHRGATL